MRARTEDIADMVAMSIALRNWNIVFCNGFSLKIPGSLSLSFEEFEGKMLLYRLELKRICFSTESACDSKNTQISHVLKAIVLDETYAVGVMKITVGKKNLENEV